MKSSNVRLMTRLVVAVALGVALFAGVARANEPVWRYEVVAGPQARVLQVNAWYARGPARELSVTTGAEPFVESVVRVSSHGAEPLPARGQSWMLAAAEDTTHVRYTFRLYDAVRQVNGDGGQLHGAVMEAVPGLYLLHPVRDDATAGTYRLTVRTPDGIAFASGLPSKDGGATFESDVREMADGARTAFGPMRVEHLTVGAGHVTLAFPPGKLPMTDNDVVAWVSARADAVARYYGRFPVPSALILITDDAGDKIDGRTDGGGGASTVLTVGRSVTADVLESDWSLTHELVHLAFPNVAHRHHWIEEGIATYVEPIVRVRVADVDERKLWSDLVTGLPQGQPEAGDQGLDHTATWGRTYWGGALFCFVADMEIRRETQGRRSIDDALRGILDAGGNITSTWPLERALAAGDRATGTRVLETLYEQWKDRPVRVNLDAWWADLGIRTKMGSVTFDDRAPLASLRHGVSDTSFLASLPQVISLRLSSLLSAIDDRAGTH